jgi:hypothetical protein
VNAGRHECVVGGIAAMHVPGVEVTVNASRISSMESHFFNSGVTLFCRSRLGHDICRTVKGKCVKMILPVHRGRIHPIVKEDEAAVEISFGLLLLLRDRKRLTCSGT